jgi:DNA-binding CsgD family transcriptional regulator
MEIIAALVAGHTCKKISNILVISYLTTETHIKHIQSKLGFNNLPSLLKFALESGLSG